MAFPIDMPLVTEWLAGLADALPVVREEAFHQLAEALADGTPAADHVVAPLMTLIESEGAKGRALGAVLLANLALEGRSTELLEQLKEQRASLETLTTRHAASTPLGAALRAITTVLAAPPGAKFVEPLAAVEALVLEADAKDEAPAPTLAEVKGWVAQVARGEGHALALAQRAFPIDPAGALAILEADASKAPATTLQQVHRAVLEAKCRAHLGQAVVLRGDWNRTAQALLLDAAERTDAKVGSALLFAVTDGSHAVRRRAVEARVKLAGGEVGVAKEIAEALASDWLRPAKAGGVNQVLGRKELVALLKKCGSARAAEVEKAPEPEVAMPEGDIL